MSLYIKPPSGNISLKSLEAFVINRLNFLMKIVEAKARDSAIIQSIINESVCQSECIISGTQKDSISHFTLRLILSKDEETSKFLLEAEIMLFQFRCWCMTEDELYRFLKTFNKLTPYFVPSSNNLHSLSMALKSLLELKKQCGNSWRNLAFKYFHSGDGVFQVPFQTVLPLVHKRLIILKNGIAFISFSQLPVFLTEIFSLFLDTGIKQARTQDSSDDRLNYLSKLVQGRCVRFLKRNTEIRRHSTPDLHLDKHSIDKYSSIFPPCMLNLHQTLRERHRLNHHARIQYTLFLKEMGMRVNNAIEFWREEYSKPVRPDTNWGTTWNRAASRYIYNIRHLYGLEGSRKNYTAHCCHSLQNQIIKPTDAGGCPFVHFDSKHFYNFLHKHNLPDNDLKHLVNLKNSGKHNEACVFYRDCVLSKNVQNETNLSSEQRRVQSVNDAETMYGDLDKHVFFKNDQMSQLDKQSVNSENIEIYKTETTKYKLDSKDNVCTRDHSERRCLNIITSLKEIKTSDKCNLVKKEIICNQSMERRCIDLDDDMELKTMSEKHKLFQSERMVVNIERQHESPKHRLHVCNDISVITNCEQVSVGREKYNIVNTDKIETPGMINGQLSEDNVPTSYEEQDDFGCDHSDCPSQRDPSQSATTVIEKPVDYCLSYQTLLHKLQQQ